MEQFDLIKSTLIDIGLDISEEDPAEAFLIADNPERGVCQLLVDCEDSILVIEQFIANIRTDNTPALARLLQMNRELIHGAFALDESGTRLLFRDTLELENLDRNEVEATIHALELGLAQFGKELIGFADLKSGE